MITDLENNLQDKTDRKTTEKMARKLGVNLNRIPLNIIIINTVKKNRSNIKKEEEKKKKINVFLLARNYQYQYHFNIH